MAKAGAQVRKKRPKDRRERIVKVAAELIADRGFAAVSVQDIGEQTGITGGAIYRHFPSKNAVLEAVLRETGTIWSGHALAVRKEATAAQQPLLRPLVVDALGMVKQHRGLVATYVREVHRAEDDVRQELLQTEVKAARCWAAAIREAQPTLSRAETEMRQQVALGAFSHLSQRPSLLASARVPQLLADALEAALSSEPVQSARTRTPENTWVGPMTRRQQILSIASRLFSQSGFHGVGFNDIGEALGIAGPSIYEYFDSKTDLLLEVYEQASALVTAGSLRAVRRATSADHALDLLIEAHVAICSDFTDFIVVTTREGASVPDEARPRLSRRRRDILERWILILREVRPSLTASEARVLVQTAFAIILQVCRMPADRRLSDDAHIALMRAFLTDQPASS